MPSIDQLEKLLASSPDDTFVLYALAQEHAKAGRHADAVGFYDRCLTADPAYLYAYFHKARSQVALDQEQQARETLTAGTAAARNAGDHHAVSELSSFLDEIS
jgi:tetratricopeptide (TPR) repeat protein